MCAIDCHRLGGAEYILINRKAVNVPPCPTSTIVHPLCSPHICAVHPQLPMWEPRTAKIAIEIGTRDHGSSAFNTPALPNGMPTQPNGLPTLNVGRYEYRKIAGGLGLVPDPTRTQKTEKLRPNLALREGVSTLHLCFVDGLCLRA